MPSAGWVRSTGYYSARDSGPQPLNEVRASFDGQLGLDADRLLPFLGPPVQDVTTIEYLTMWWLGVIQRYLAAVERGLPVTAFRHEDITGRPEAVLQNVAKLCNLPGATLRPLRAVRAKDAQAGTPLAQEGRGEAHLRLAPEQIRRVQAIVGRHPLIGDPAFRIPARSTSPERVCLAVSARRLAPIRGSGAVGVTACWSEHTPPFPGGSLLSAGYRQRVSEEEYG